MMDIRSKPVASVVITEEMLADYQYVESMGTYIARGIGEALEEQRLTELHGPKLGPRRVPNDAQQAEADRRAALAHELLELADEWGVYDLVRGDEW